MGTCLVTKLNGTVSDDTLLKLGELKAKIFGKSTTSQFSVTGSSFSVDGQTYESGAKYTFPDAGVENQHDLVIFDKYSLTRVQLGVVDNGMHSTLDLSDFAFSNAITAFTDMQGSSGNSSYPCVKGDISVFSKMPNLTEIRFINNKKIFGDIASLSELKYLVTLYLNGCGSSSGQIVGDFGELGKIPTINTINLFSTGVLGTVEDFVENAVASGRSFTTAAKILLQYCTRMTFNGSNLGDSPYYRYLKISSDGNSGYVVELHTSSSSTTPEYAANYNPSAAEGSRWTYNSNS